jgi:hypothetical protein
MLKDSGGATGHDASLNDGSLRGSESDVSTTDTEAGSGGKRGRLMVGNSDGSGSDGSGSASTSDGSGSSISSESEEEPSSETPSSGGRVGTTEKAEAQCRTTSGAVQVGSAGLERSAGVAGGE